MPLELFIALRYLKARRHGVFTLLTTMIAVGGITLGVAALIITLSVMSGFHKDIKEKILGVQPHLIVLKQDQSPFIEYTQIMDRAAKSHQVKALAPFVYGQSILRSYQFTQGVIVKGVQLDKEEKLAALGKNIVNGVILPLKIGRHDIILGQELGRNLGIREGEELILTSPGQIASIPRMEKFKVIALFHSGMYEYDSNLAYISLDAAQKLFGMGNAVTGIGISLKDWEKTRGIEKKIQNLLGYPYHVRSWEDMNRNLFAALKLEKIMMFIILTLIILVAAFNIISNLILLTVEKAKEIGIMSAMGFKKAKIAAIFFYEGLIIGFCGIFLGLGLGIGISLLLKKYQFIHLPADVYYLDTLPVRILAGDVIGVAGAAFLITIVAGIYPAYQVSRLDPLDAIRYG